jgi:hypothetical protein
MLDPENWKIVFEVYKAHPTPALTLAYQLVAIKQSLERGNKGIPDAIKALDLAIEVSIRIIAFTSWAINSTAV